MVHARAKLTPFGRLLVVQRVGELGWPVAQAAESMGVSRATAYKWLRRFRSGGLEGLKDSSSRPSHCRHALPAITVDRILRLRRHWRRGPHRLSPVLGIPRSTVYGVLRRPGVSRLRDNDRATAIPVRYVRDRPGELVHLDIKKLGRIPQDGGHRFRGRQGVVRGRSAEGYEYLHVAVDDASRLAFVRVFPDERGVTTARFLLEAGAFYAKQGIRIERILTDRAMAYTLSPVFQQAVATLGARHKTTRPYRPQTNGKAERFIRTLLDEWAYARLYQSNDHRLAQLPRWLTFYNSRRPHTGLGGRPPASVINNVQKNYS